MPNKYQEALDKLLLMLIWNDKSELTCGDISKQSKILQELIDKSMPKQCHISEDNFAICPICKEHLQWDGKEKVTYCCHCGQAIDWSENE